MNMFKPSKAKTMTGYLQAISEPRRSDVKTLHEFIKQTVRRLRPHFAYNMLGYGSFAYTSASGTKGEWPVIALASQKNYISVYVCSVRDGKYVAELYRRDFPKANIGKSCIRFRRLADIDLKKLAVVLKVAEKNPGLGQRRSA